VSLAPVNFEIWHVTAGHFSRSTVHRYHQRPASHEKSIVSGQKLNIVLRWLADCWRLLVQPEETVARSNRHGNFHIVAIGGSDQ
jgi:hypothetical protein